MTSRNSCAECGEKLQMPSDGRGRKHQLCNGCRSFSEVRQKADAEARKCPSKAISTTRFKQLKDPIAKERYCQWAIKDAKKMKNLEAASFWKEQLAKIRKHIRKGSKDIDEAVLGFSRRQFLLWREKPINRRCHFCHITDEDLNALVLTGKSRMTPFVGVRRIDDSKPYAISNIMPCCKRCRAMQSKPIGFTVAELEQLGPTLKKLWVRRLNGV